MKHFTKIISIMFIVLNLIVPVNAANRKSNLFVLSRNDDSIMNYASENFGNILSSRSFDVVDKTNIILGSGIKVFNENNENKYIFPVILEGNIIASYYVMEENGEFGSVYTEVGVEVLRQLVNKTSYNNYAVIYENNNGLIVCLNNNYTYIDGNYAPVMNKPTTNVSIIDCFEPTEFQTVKAGSRYGASYILSFTPKYQQPTGKAKCYSYALATMLYNQGYNRTPTAIQSYCKNADGATISQLSSYLSSINFSHTKGTSYMDPVTVYNTISSGKYIYIGGKNSSSGTGHAFVLFGYTIGANVYHYWNPWYTTTDTMSIGTRKMITKSGSTYVWNIGYIYKK